ncbi:hypothetical protein NPX13_g3889 [Xylaria arbuscula]|uniref:Uncharacterized protein n=1 Tax=Xylaria arbuscula TaxID=114810 RepID=A0A9W8NHV9_9PEZI|nr:hypothetical protein NPX13_g3889 [Xylaria arbuscula]
MTAVIKTTMNYYLDPSKGGSGPGTFGTVGVLRRKFDAHHIQVQDLRGLENDLDIHTHTFQICQWKPTTTSLDSHDIKQNMYHEAEELIRNVTKATRVECFSHLIRQNTFESNVEALRKLEAAKGAIPDKQGIGTTVPAQYAHIDQSRTGALSLLQHNLPGEVERLTKTRWGTINLWRPIKTIRRDPLCYCDGRTISDEDLVPVFAKPPPKEAGASPFYDTKHLGDGFQTLEVRANPNHKWYYLSEMRPDEALIFKCYDSKNPSESRCCHSSFRLPQTVDEPRESMEMRFFVFYENEPLHGM